MATEEQASTVTSELSPFAEWSGWLAMLVGLWVVVSPFVLTGSITEGTPMWSNVVAGVVVLLVAAYAAYSIRSAEGAPAVAEWSGWIAALAGVWIAVSPFVLTGTITEGTAMWSNVAAGAIALALAAYAAFVLHNRK